MKIEAVIGGWLLQYREQAGLSQAQVGEELGKYLGKTWTRQAVWAAEKGRRSFTAAELVAFAVVLGCSMESLTQPPVDVPAVVLGDGPPLDSRYLRGADGAASDTSLAKLVQTMSAIRREYPALLASAQRIDELLDDAALALWSAARGRGISTPNSLMNLPPRVPKDEP